MFCRLLLWMRNIPIFLWGRVQKKLRHILLAWKILHLILNPTVILETVTRLPNFLWNPLPLLLQNYAIQDHHCSRPAKSVFPGPVHLSCHFHSIEYEIRSSWITCGPGFCFYSLPFSSPSCGIKPCLHPFFFLYTHPHDDLIYILFINTT